MEGRSGLPRHQSRLCCAAPFSPGLAPRLPACIRVVVTPASVVDSVSQPLLQPSQLSRPHFRLPCYPSFQQPPTPAVIMHNHQIVMAAIAGLASTAAANVNFHAVGALSQMSPAVVPRQNIDMGDECLNDIMQILSTVPQPPQELVEWAEDEAENMDITDASALADLCTPVADFPASLTSASAAYETTLMSWLSKESSAMVSVISSCSTNEYVQSASSLLDEATKDPACSSVLASATASLSGLLPTGTPVATGSGGSGSGPAPTGENAPQESDPVPAAAGHNGVVASFLVGAGFLGLVAML